MQCSKIKVERRGRVVSQIVQEFDQDMLLGLVMESESIALSSGL